MLNHDRSEERTKNIGYEVSSGARSGTGFSLGFGDGWNVMKCFM